MISKPQATWLSLTSFTTNQKLLYLMVAYVNVRFKQNKEIVLSGQSIDKSYKSFSSKACTNNKIGQNEEATIYKDQIVKYN